MMVKSLVSSNKCLFSAMVDLFGMRTSNLVTFHEFFTILYHNFEFVSYEELVELCDYFWPSDYLVCYGTEIACVLSDYLKEVSSGVES